MKTFALLLILLSSIFIGCGRPDCHNINPVFDEFAPESEEYKAALAHELDDIDRSKLSYFFIKDTETRNNEFLFYIQGNSLCAKIIFTVKDFSELDEIHKKKESISSRKKFKNLDFDVKKDSLRTEFILKNLEMIID